MAEEAWGYVPEEKQVTIESLVFVGFNARVAALDRDTGKLVWDWRSPKPYRGYVSLLLLDECQLIVSVNGYTYCLDPLTGEQRWFNELVGFGSGVASIVALNKNNPLDSVVAGAAATAQAQAAAASAG